ncbi:MAG: hypothetical protein DRH57_06140 [Candidatus Cloacimonadota bacterium]|nr:MAG: hypothetical protein DRH57_06140 [Candidatus Cloacimonadota bacterium]
MKAKTVFILIIIVLFLIVLFQNIQTIILNLFFWKLNVSTIVLLPLTLFIGFIVGYIVAKTTTKKHNDIQDILK